MSEYSEQFKLSIIEQYLSGSVGHKQIADKHNLHHSTVRLWIKLHAAHGIGGLVKKFSHYNAEFKLSVLQHMWAADLSCWQAGLLPYGYILDPVQGMPPAV